jgi:predicted ATPase
MPLVIITGGPGLGKTTLLRKFELLGRRTVPESARAVVADRPARGRKMVNFYRALGYELQEVSVIAADPRARHVLRVLARSDASR